MPPVLDRLAPAGSSRPATTPAAAAHADDARSERSAGAPIAGDAASEAATESRPFSRLADRPAASWLLPVGTLLLWELLARAGALRENWFPAPSRVVLTLVGLAEDGGLQRHVAATLLRVALGFTLGALAATLAGIATGRSRVLRVLADPSLQALRTIPSLAWVPLFMLWLGIGESSKVALIALGAFFPVYLNLTTGLRAIDPRLLELARLFGYRRWRLARAILLPATLPAYLSGLRGGLGLGWMFVVAAELMGASRGLGYLLVDGQTTGRPALVMASIAMFALLGKLSDRGLEQLGARWQRWRPPAPRE
jgi:sulfonate transport system permease protein